MNVHAGVEALRTLMGCCCARDAHPVHIKARWVLARIKYALMRWVETQELYDGGASCTNLKFLGMHPV